MSFPTSARVPVPAVVFVTLVLAACAPAAPGAKSPAPEPPAATVVVESSPPPPTGTASLVAEGMADTLGSDDGSVFAITDGDAAVGRPDAPVTIVVFGDLQCPFTSRYLSTLDQVQQRYSSELRIVWKNLPLEFHKEARPAAEVAAAVHAIGRAPASWCVLHALLDKQRELGADTYRAAARKCGVDPDTVEAVLRSGGPARAVDRDVALAGTLGIRGTPQSFVNGLRISGAQSADQVGSAIDREIAAAQRLLRSGTPPLRVHADRVAENLRPDAPPAPSGPSAAAASDTTVWNVPIGPSPVLGSADALVTIVVFSDFQCPFCKRAASTVEQIRTTYGREVRIVFKNNPLPFHPFAEPAAELTLEARRQQGDAGFWRAHDALFNSTAPLDDTQLGTIVAQLGLNRASWQTSRSTGRHRAALAADQTLAQQLGATGTPTFYVNGRKLVGAQPYERFKALVDEVLPAARELVRKGTPRASLYAELIKNGQTGPARP